MRSLTNMSANEKHRRRVTSGLLIGGVVSTAAILGGWVWALLAVVFFPIAYREMMALMTAKNIHPSQVTVLLFSVIFYVFAFMGWERHFEIVVTVGLIFTFSRLLLRQDVASICDVGGTILMFFYLGYLPAHFILLRQIGADQVPEFWLQPGLRYLFLVLFVVSASDIFAYYGGKRFGKKLLSPKISPKKTIEGSALGAGFALIIGVIVSLLFNIPWYHGAILGVILSVVAQLGDLSESLLKRDAGMKDSGTFLPGHGGILDRTDSYIFSGAAGYYYIIWFVLHLGLAQDVMKFFGR